MKELSTAGLKSHAPVGPGSRSQERPASARAETPGRRQSAVAKVSHTLSVPLAERLESFAFFQRISESAVIEHSLKAFFEQSSDDSALGEVLRRGGAGRRRKS